jgi:hypothetical protein
MFTIESEAIFKVLFIIKFKGGFVKWYTQQNQMLYRLRHLTTMEYLSITNSSDQEFLLTMEKNYEKASLFRFELIFSTLTLYNREKA